MLKRRTLVTATIIHELRNTISADGAPLRPLRADRLSDITGASISYLEQILIPLRRAHIIEGVKGPGGGYRLRRTEVSMQEILDIVGEAERPTKRRINTERIENLVLAQIGKVTIAIGPIQYEEPPNGKEI